MGNYIKKSSGLWKKFDSESAKMISVFYLVLGRPLPWVFKNQRLRGKILQVYQFKGLVVRSL